MSLELRKYSMRDLSSHLKLLKMNDVPATKKKESNWLKKSISNYKKKTPEFYVLAIIFKGKLIGNVCAENIDYKNKNLQIGYWIGKNFQGKGFATLGVKKFLIEIEKKFNPIRIQASFYSSNKTSEKVLKKCEFKKEGILEKKILIKNKFVDEFIYARVK